MRGAEAMARLEDEDRSAAPPTGRAAASPWPVSRELDRGARRVSAILGLPRVALRVMQILFWAAVTATGFPFLWAQRQSVPAALGASHTYLCVKLGAPFIKIGQIISPRPDLFPPAF